ncbi:MAG: hypothetical protein KU38_00640 [Sulfurovum sp. FS08-3]|nr:MAG: hypothetical protein KU38_00640 [Sulfurovum sp. FS08-3]
MNLKFYIDTNIFLNSYLNRDNSISTKVLLFLEQRGVEIAINDISVVNIAYILRKKFSSDEINQKINTLLSKYQIICANQTIIKQSNDSTFKDFEDGIQYFCAKEAQAHLIITDNINDFKASNIEVITAKEFYKKYIEE